MAGRRLSVWIPEGELWFFTVLDRLAQHVEATGCPTSLGEVVRGVLKQGLEPKRKKLGIEKDDPVPLDQDAGLGKGQKRSIAFRREDMDVVEALERIVRAKRASGFRTSFSHELLRVARAGLLTGLEPPGAALDRAILAEEPERC